MERNNISFEHFEEIIGEKNMKSFCLVMKEKIDYSSKKQLQVGFVNDSWYQRYEERFWRGKKVPKNYDTLLELSEVLRENGQEKEQEEIFELLAGKRISISYMRIRRRLICFELEKGSGVKKIANDYDCNLSTVYRIKNMFCKTSTKNKKKENA